MKTDNDFKECFAQLFTWFAIESKIDNINCLKNIFKKLNNNQSPIYHKYLEILKITKDLNYIIKALREYIQSGDIKDGCKLTEYLKYL